MKEDVHVMAVCLDGDRWLAVAAPYHPRFLRWLQSLKRYEHIWMQRPHERIWLVGAERQSELVAQLAAVYGRGRVCSCCHQGRSCAVLLDRLDPGGDLRAQERLAVPSPQKAKAPTSVTAPSGLSGHPPPLGEDHVED